jgi:hypothetical protein
MLEKQFNRKERIPKGAAFRHCGCGASRAAVSAAGTTAVLGIIQRSEQKEGLTFRCGSA